MKRPLVTVAAGFVLGEVLALQYKQAAAAGFLAMPVLALALALGIAPALGALPGRAKRQRLCGDEMNLGIPSIFRGLKDNMQGRNAGKRAFLLFFALVLAGGGCGYGRSIQVKKRLDRDERAAGEFAGAKVTAAGIIVKVEYKAESAGVELENVTIRAGRRAERIEKMIVYAAGDVDMEEAAVGLKAEFRGKLDIVEGPRNPGEFDFRGYYRSKGIVCRMFGEEIAITGGEALPYYNFLTRFRLWCSGILDRICLPEDSPVFKAVLLGDTSWLEPQVRSMYQRSGISHLLAVSGQHLTIIGGGLYLVLRKCGLRFKTAGIAAGMLVVSFGIMTGSSGSAMRAVVMILCLWLAAATGRSYDTLSALGLAALILLIRRPYLLFQSGFQLSFGAVLAIGGLGNWLTGMWEIEKGWQKTLTISLCVQIVITPVVLYHYYLYPLYGILLNLLVIPLISVLMYSGILGIALGSFWVQGGTAAVGAGHYILRFYERLCGTAERLPGYSLVTGHPQWWQTAVYGCVMAGILWGGTVFLRRRKIGKAAGGIALGICSYCLCFLILLPLPVKGLEVICLDVGQGDGIVLETKEGVVLVDGGSSSEKSLGDKTLEPFLKSRGRGVIEYSIVSHGDSDHISGLLYLLEESEDVKIRNLILPAPGRGQEIYRRLEQAAIENGTRVSYMGPGGQVDLGELKLLCLYAGDGSSSSDRNAHSLVFCADYRDFHMLFTGDMGIEQERGLLQQAEGGEEAGSAGHFTGYVQAQHLKHTTVLKAAHHGSATSSSQAFLERLSPALAVVSYGRGNSYGHPAPQVLERFENLGISVMETGAGGAVILKTDGSRLRRRYFLDGQR